jgi:hypothetical protein
MVYGHKALEALEAVCNQEVNLPSVFAYLYGLEIFVRLGVLEVLQKVVSGVDMI